jgi:uncharacterized membrane protein
MFALASIGRQADKNSQDVAPALTVGVALLLAVVSVGVFVALVQRGFDSTQIGGILRDLTRRAFHVIEDVHPEGGAVDPRVPAGGEGADELRHMGAPAVVASVDRAALVRLARQTGAFVEVVPMIGQYVVPGEVTLRLHGAAREPDPRAGRRVLLLARQRSIDQDPAFALRMLVDIAIRGLSPAVNDPTTAVQALDRIEALLVELHRRGTGPSVVVDTDGVEHGLFPAPTWAEYMELGLMEIRHYGAGSAQIARRLRALPAERELLARPDRLGLGGAMVRAGSEPE